MRVPRIYTPLALKNNSIVNLDASASIHIRDVLRLKLKARAVLFNGDGCDYYGEIVSQTKKKLEIFIVDVQPVDNESKHHIQLLQPLCRSDKMDWCIQKATELGVQHISPVICQHSNAKLATNKIDKKLDHWQSVIQSACEQSGRAVIPKIDAPASLADAFSRLSTKSIFRIISSPGAKQSLTELSNPNQQSVFLVGPEGGFSEDELILARNYDFEPITLGPRILRLETAVITTLSILQSRWGDLN